MHQSSHRSSHHRNELGSHYDAITNIALLRPSAGISKNQNVKLISKRLLRFSFVHSFFGQYYNHRQFIRFENHDFDVCENIKEKKSQHPNLKYNLTLIVRAHLFSLRSRKANRVVRVPSIQFSREDW
jgi:hypothetical protein